MASPIKILDMRITAEEAQGERGLEAVQQLRPDWPKEKIRHKKLSGGFINVMLKFFSEDNPADAIVFRVYGGKLGEELISHDNELMVIQIAHHSGCFPPILAFLPNGIAYKYATGRPMLGKDFENPVTIRAVARALCGFHNANMAACKLVDRNGNPTTFPTDNFTLFSGMRKRISVMAEKNPDPERQAMLENNKITPAWLLKQVEEMEKPLEELQLSKTVCHYDFHQGNVLYDDKTGIATVVDFEATQMGYEAFDIAGMFVEEAWRGKTDGFYADGKPPRFTEDVKRTWAKEYITRKYELQGRDPKEVTDDVVEMMYLEHELLATVFHLNWLCNFATVLHKLDFHLPAFEYFKTEYEEYIKARKNFDSIKQQYQTVKAKVAA